MHPLPVLRAWSALRNKAGTSGLESSVPGADLSQAGIYACLGGMKWTFHWVMGGLAGVLMAGALLSGCTTVPETGRAQFNIMDASQETQLGLSSFNQLKQQTPISANATANAMLQRVGKRIAAVAPLPGAQWEFVLFESKEVNAFCLPGGKVGVFTGILPITKDEAGLATVIGHEVAHAVARHGGERMTHAMASGLAAQLLQEGMQGSRYQAAAMVAYGAVSKVGFELPYSRAHESEADYMGLLYMARAGYDPEQAVAFWERFAAFNRQQGASQGLAFLRTHPLDEKRIMDLKAAMPRAKAEYRPGAR